MEEKSNKIVKKTKKQLEDSEKKVMKRKDEEKSKAVKTLMIATYREEYGEESLDIIRQIIEQEEPEEIIVLKILDEKASSEKVDANIGMESKKDFLESVREEKKKQINSYAEEIVRLVEEFDIPSQVNLRKGENIASEIINEFSERDVDHLIMHGPKKGPLGKIIEGSVSENVKKSLDTEKVTQLN